MVGSLSKIFSNVLESFRIYLCVVISFKFYKDEEAFCQKCLVLGPPLKPRPHHVPALESLDSLYIDPSRFLRIIFKTFGDRQDDYCTYKWTASYSQGG